MNRKNTLSEKATSSIHVIGMNAGGMNELSQSLTDLVISTKKIGGSRRLIKSLKSWWKNQNTLDSLPELFESNDANEIINWFKTQDESIVLLSSGDALWFGIGRILLEHFPKNRISFYPSPTSLQLAFSKLRVPWHEAKWMSLHGRDPEPLKKLLLKRHKIIGLLTDPNRGGAEEVRKALKALGLEKNYALWIFERPVY